MVSVMHESCTRRTWGGAFFIALWLGAFVLLNKQPGAFTRYSLELVVSPIAKWPGAICEPSSRAFCSALDRSFVNFRDCENSLSPCYCQHFLRFLPLSLCETQRQRGASHHALLERKKDAAGLWPACVLMPAGINTQSNSCECCVRLMQFIYCCHYASGNEAYRHGVHFLMQQCFMQPGYCYRLLMAMRFLECVHYKCSKNHA